MEIIDSQVHIWEPHSGKQPKTDTHVHRNAKETVAAMDEAGVARALLNQRSWEGFRNDIALDAARRYPDRFGVIGTFDMSNADAVGRLQDWKGRDPGMVCIRLNLLQDRRRYLYDGTDAEFWPLAEANRVPVMVTAPGSLDRIESILESYPHLRVAIDHMGFRSGDSHKQRERAVASLRPLTRFPKVAVKVTGTPCYVADLEAYPYRSIHGQIREVVEAFGCTRVFWGTDLSRLPCTYREAVTMFTEEMEWTSDDELAYVMGRAIKEWLEWDWEV